jgi:hypothetical protein
MLWITLRGKREETGRASAESVPTDQRKIGKAKLRGERGMSPPAPSSGVVTPAARFKAERRLTAIGAVLGALLGRRLEHYPRFPQADGCWKKVPDSDLIERIATRLASLKPEDANLKDALERGRESLDEVKELTEYQDQKATRLLTIITFLSALSGILFARFVESYPLHATLAQVDLASWGRVLVIISYALFGFFALLAICGALVVFHATRTQFRYPDTEAGAKEKTGSYLFYKSIIEVTPEAWARSFVAEGSDDQIAPDLQLRYLRNYIIETYLVAAKVAEKLRYLQPAQVILSWSIRALLFWLVFIAATIAFVPVKGHTSDATPPTALAADLLASVEAPLVNETGDLAREGASTR